MNWSAGVMTGLMEMARGRGKDNVGEKRAEAEKFQAVWRTRGTKSFETVEPAHYPH